MRVNGRGGEFKQIDRRAVADGDFIRMGADESGDFCRLARREIEPATGPAADQAAQRIGRIPLPGFG